MEDGLPMQQSSSERRGAVRAGQPWHAALFAGLTVLLVCVIVVASGGTAAVALVLAAIALALAAMVVVCWPERFGGSTSTDSARTR
jgi:hypothetical protein